MNRRTFVGRSAATAATLASSGLAKPSALSQVDFPEAKRGPEKNEGWSLAVIPDTQNYVKYAKNQANLQVITQWLRDHAEAWRLQAVLHEGDFVEQNDIAEGGGRGYGDQNAASQWDAARTAMAKLDGRVPTIYATGNHDYGTRNAENRRTQFNSYFGLTDNPLVADGSGGGIWRESGTNAFGARTLENAAYEIAAPDGRKLLILSLEWGPRRESVAWGNSILGQERYRDHLGILLTHDFLTPQNERDSKDNRPGNPHWYKTGKGGNTHDGEDLWQRLVQPSRQIQLVLNGHEMGRHVGYRHDPGTAGQTVHQMLFNAQGLGGGSKEKGNGGDGWIRFLTFAPDGKTLTVRTFSPLRQKNGQPHWYRDPAWSFRLQLQSAQ